MNTRIEQDSMGPVELPAEAYWGAQSQRAAENFGVSPYRMPPAFRRALAGIKETAARVNAELGLLPAELAEAIAGAAGRVRSEEAWQAQFPVDVFQTGSGTSWNMNMNEVVAGLANEQLTGQRGGKSPVHPNDHVNRGQSSNDVIPSALNLAGRLALEPLLKELTAAQAVLEAKAAAWRDLPKIGRTHLQDAVPMRVGAEVSAWARQLELARVRLAGVAPRLAELALGGTALGSGLNAHPDFGARCADALSRLFGLSFRRAENLYEAISARDVQVELMGQLNGLAVALMKIANDLRLLASGPRTGLGEYLLPELQPGSSIMPGKVNPVIPEMTLQAAAHVMGQAVAVTVGAQNSPLQLAIAMPLLAHESLSALELMTNTVRVLRERCLEGLEVDGARCTAMVEQSLALVTPLALKLGYDQAAALSKQALDQGVTIRELVRQKGLLSLEEEARYLDVRGMLGD